MPPSEPGLPVLAEVIALAGDPDRRDSVGRRGPTYCETVLGDTDVALGTSATLLQFSSAFCVPCRATRRILTDVAAVVPGVRHLDVDAEHHLELVRELGIMRTPTTLILDKHGREVRRAVGAPRKEDVFAALTEAV